MTSSKDYIINFSEKTLRSLFRENLFRYNLINSIDRAELADNHKLQSIYDSAKKLSYSATFIDSLIKHETPKTLYSKLRYDSYNSLNEFIRTKNILLAEFERLKKSKSFIFSTILLDLIPLSDLHNLKQYLRLAQKQLTRLKRSKRFKAVISYFVIKYELSWTISNSAIYLLLHIHFILAVDNTLDNTIEAIRGIILKYFTNHISIDIQQVKSITRVTSYILKSVDNAIFHESKKFIVPPIYKLIVLSELKGFHLLTTSRNLNNTYKRRHTKNDLQIHHC